MSTMTESRTTPPASNGKRAVADDDNSVLPSFLALAFALLLVILGVWLFSANRENEELQRCFAEHRQDCVPLDTARR